MLPEARAEGLFFQRLGEDLVVYDAEIHKYHHLNPTAALIWENCDGRTPVPALARVIQEHVSPEADEATVWAALLLLKDAGLLKEAGLPEEALARTRRAFLRDATVLGRSAVYAAAIATLIAPTVAHAQSSPGLCTKTVCCW